MRHVFVMIGCCLCLGLGACEDEEAAAREKEMLAAVASLVQAERDFAATVKAEGIKAGFLSVLHPDGILFNPTPTNGVALYEAAGESGALLTWEPRYAELASSLDLGYTTGPWEYFTSDTATEAVAFGDYFSIWKRDSAGVWQLVLDIGVSRSAPEPMHELKTRVLDEVGKGNWPRVISDAPVIRDTNAIYPRNPAASDLSTADNRWRAKGSYTLAATNDIRVLRDKMPRMIGADDSALANLSAFSSREQGADISKAGDLGFVFGTAEGKITQPDGTEVDGLGGYVRVWRRYDLAKDPSVEGRTPPTTRAGRRQPTAYTLAAEVMSMRPKQ